MEWEAAPLKRFLAINDSRTWGDDPTAGEVTPVIRSTEIQRDRSWSLENVALRPVSDTEKREKTLEIGDLVVVKSSGSPAHLGKTAIVTEDVAARRPCFANFVQRLRPTAHADSRYVWYLLNSQRASAEMEALGSTTTGLRNLNGEIIGSVTFPGPPLEAQRAIAEFLDVETARIDALVVKKRKMIKLIGERRMAAMVAGVSGRLSPKARRTESTLPWLDSIPAHWDEVGLTLVARLGSGHTPSRKRADWWVESECVIPWITTGEVARLRSDRVEYIEETRERISPIGLDNSSAEVHAAGTVVLCRTASAGYSGIMRHDMATSQDFAAWTYGPLLRPRFLLLCLRAMRADLLGRLAMGSTHQTIYMPDIQSLRIPLPPVDEQDQIVESVWAQMDSRNRAEDLLVRQTDLLVERRQALITAAVTGQLDVARHLAKAAS